jgi:hypothetical protein
MLASPKRLPVTSTHTFGFSAIAGRSLDGDTVQIFISNYAIPAGYKPHSFGMPPEIQKLGPPPPDFSKVKFLPPRTDRLPEQLRLQSHGQESALGPFGLHRQAFPHQQQPESRFGRRKIRQREYPLFGQPLIPGTVEPIVVQRKADSATR